MTQYINTTPVLSPAVLGGIEKIARRYTLPAKCPITRDDLIQEGCLGYLEAQINHPDKDERKLLNYARKAMQQAFSEYVSPVTRSLDDEIGHDDNGAPITLLDKLASDIAIDSSCEPSIREERLRLLQADCIRRSEVLTPREHLILSRLYGLNGEKITPAENLARQLGLTYNNIRKIKQRILKKLRRQLSQNPKSSVYK